MTFIVSLLVFWPKIILGFALAHYLWKARDFPAILLKLGIGVPLGLAISSSLFFLAMIVGIKPDLYSQMELWGMLLIDIVIISKMVIALKPIRIPSMPSRQEALGISIVGVGLILSAAALYTYARMHPYGFWDAWTMWNFVARFIYRANSPAVILDYLNYPHPNPDYPLSLSLNVAWAWLALKKETVYIPMTLAFYAMTAPVLVVWMTLRKWKGIFAGALCAMMVLATPNLLSVVGQYADALVALHILSAVALFYGYLKSKENGLLILAGLLAGSSAWVKNEGILFVIVFSTVCFLASLKNGNVKDTAPKFLMGLIPPLVIVLMFKLAINNDNYLFSESSSNFIQIADIHRWRFIVREFASGLFSYNNWPVSFLIVLATYALIVGVSKDERDTRIWIALIFVGQLLGYFAVYLVTPLNVQQQLFTSLDRVFSHIIPVLIFWVFVTFRAPLSSETIT